MSVCFCACSQINSAIITNKDGSIDEIVSVELNMDKIIEADLSVADINQLKDNIREDAQYEANLMKEKLNEKIDLHLLNPNVDNDTKTILKKHYDGITIKEAKWQNDKYSIKVKFKDINVYKYYYNIKDSDSVEMKEEEHFFYNKVYWYGNTMFAKHRELYVNLKTKYETKYPNLVNHADTQLTYTYSADLRRLHSDADYVEKVNGNYYHTWVVDQNDVDQKIMFYYNIANTYNWIIVSLLLTLGITIILIIVAIIIKIIKK